MSTVNSSFLRHFRMRFDIFFGTDATHIIFIRNPMDRIVTLAGYGRPICPGNHYSLSLLFCISLIIFIHLLWYIASFAVTQIPCCMCLVAVKMKKFLFFSANWLDTIHNYFNLFLPSIVHETMEFYIIPSFECLVICPCSQAYNHQICILWIISLRYFSMNTEIFIILCVVLGWSAYLISALLLVVPLAW